MKTKIFRFASRMAVLALAVCLSVGLASCNKDDDESSELSAENALVGTWFLQDKDYWEEITFLANGKGTHDNSAGSGGTLNWKITSPNFVYIQMWYYYQGIVSKSEYGWNYTIKDNTLSINGKKYTRK